MSGPTQAQPSLSLLESPQRILPVTLSRFGSEATPLPDPARLRVCGSDLWLLIHQTRPSTHWVSTRGLPLSMGSLAPGPVAGTSHNRLGRRKWGPLPSIINIFAHSCTLITHTHKCTVLFSQAHEYLHKSLVNGHTRVLPESTHTRSLK